jgi:hypothetical protein
LPDGRRPRTVDNIIPRAAGGSDDPDNLAAACMPCNRSKWDATDGIDRRSGQWVPFFNPRRQDWAEHFRWDRSYQKVIGRTAIGRVTAARLRLNRAEYRLQRGILRGAAAAGALT